MDDPSFAAAARRLAGFSAVVLGWRPDEFWRATPAELAAVVEALCGGRPSAAPADTDDLERLRRMFPDG